MSLVTLCVLIAVGLALLYGVVIAVYSLYGDGWISYGYTLTDNPPEQPQRHRLPVTQPPPSGSRRWLRKAAAAGAPARLGELPVGGAGWARAGCWVREIRVGLE